MSSEPVKIDSKLHEDVKKFVDEEGRYGSYKSFYEDAARKLLDQELQDDEVKKLKTELEKLKKELK